MKRLLLLCLIFTTMLLALSCKEGKQKTSGTNSVTDAAKEEVTGDSTEDNTTTGEDGQGESNSATDKAGDSGQNKNDHASTEAYDLTEVSYEKDGISIKYPKLTGLKDTIKQDKINQLIEQDAMKDTEDYMIEGAALEVGYEISWKGKSLLSIKFVVYSNYPGAAHPNHSFYSTNIALDTASRVMLKDTVELSNEFVADFIKGSVYTAPFEEVNRDLQDLLENDIKSLNPEGLLMADADGVYTPYYSYYTETSLGIGIEVPFAVGGYALYEVPYKDISKDINYNNQIWKDFPEVPAQAGASGETGASGIAGADHKAGADNQDEAVVQEGDSFLPIVVEELLLGGYDGEDWVELQESLSRVKEGETYQLYHNQNYIGTVAGKAPELDVDFQTFYMVKMEEADIHYNIAIGSDQELNSVKPRKADKSYYEEAVLSYFEEIDHPEYKIGYLEGYSYDYDRDGDEEDIIVTWQFQDQFYYEMPSEGCYSYVLYRDKGRMKVIQEAYRGGGQRLFCRISGYSRRG